MPEGLIRQATDKQPTSRNKGGVSMGEHVRQALSQVRPKSVPSLPQLKRPEVLLTTAELTADLQTLMVKVGHTNRRFRHAVLRPMLAASLAEMTNSG